MAKPYIVRTKFDEEALISKIKLGTSRECEIIKEFNITRGVAKRYIAMYAPKDRIKLPSRKGLNPVPIAATALKPPAADAAKPKDAPASLWGRIMQIFGGLVALVIALAFGSAGGFFNYQYCSSLGRDPFIAFLLGCLGVSIDAGSTFLPTFASTLAEKGRHWQAGWAGVLWIPCIFMTVIMELGFASSSIGDSLQARGDVTKLRTSIEEQLEQIKEDRKKIDDPLILEKKIAAARDGIAYSRLASSKDCTDVTISFTVCDPLIQLRKAKEIAEAHIANANKKQETLTVQKLALPPVSSKSPLADIVQKITGVSPEQTEFWQSIMLAMLCAVSPGLFMWFSRGQLR